MKHFFLSISHMSCGDSQVLEGDSTLVPYPINYRIPSPAFVAPQNQPLDSIFKLTFYNSPATYLYLSQEASL